MEKVIHRFKSDTNFYKHFGFSERQYSHKVDKMCHDLKLLKIKNKKIDKVFA